MVLVDAYNVLHRARRRRRAVGWDLLTLATEIARHTYFRREVVLVCDGLPPPGLLPAWREHAPSKGDPLTFHFAGDHQEADDVIESLLASSARPAGLLVVSCDSRLRAAAAHHGAAHLPGLTLVTWLTQPHNAPASLRPAFAEAIPLSRTEVELWLRELGLAPGGSDPAPHSAAPPSTAPAQTPSLGASDGPARSPSRLRQAASPVDPRVQAPLDPDPKSTPDLVPTLDMEHWLKLFPPTPADIRGSASPKVDARTSQKRREHDPRRARG